MRSATVIILALLVATVAFAGGKDKNEEPLALSRGLLDCSNAISILCGETLSGDNTGMPNNVVNYSCTTLNENGGEVVYELVLAGGACYEVTVTLVPGGCDLDLFFLGSCDEADCIDYSAGVSTETIVTPCIEGGTYYIVVDGYGSAVPGAQCAFDITVDCQACECPEEPCCPSVYECYIADFNICDNDFTTEGCGGASCSWDWGQPVFDVGSYYGPVPDVACDGVPVTTLLATNLTGYYVNCGERAIIGPYDINASCWCMELCHYYDTEFSFDGGNVKVSADGGATWSLVYPQRGYDDDAAYASTPCVALQPIFSGHAVAQGRAFVRDCFDLSAYVGQSIYVAFDFGADTSVFYPGWYIKWVKIGSDEFSPVEGTSWGIIKAMYR